MNKPKTPMADALRAGILVIAATAPEPTRAQLCELVQSSKPEGPAFPRRPVEVVGLFRKRVRAVATDRAGNAALEFALLAAGIAAAILIPLHHLGPVIQGAVLHIVGSLP